MRRFSKASFLSLLTLFLAVSLPAAIPFPQAESDLRPDPAATYGTLPNGLRYVVMPNHEPKNRASLRLLVLAGSFEETDAQRGLAHFLEHMAFNGSTHFAPGTLVERLQRLGMGFGADTNASTSFDRTLYQLELPDTAPSTLAEGLQILADYGGGLLLEPKMIDKEREIILSEKRTRDSVGYRTLVAQLDFLEAGTRVPERLPIGLQSVIEKANREPFLEFYNAWYRPELLAVVVVGDVDPKAVESKIVDTFSGLAPRAPEPPAVDLGRVEQIKEPRFKFHSEPEAPETQIIIASVVPYAHEPDTAAYRKALLPRSLALEMLNRRLSILAKKENAPFMHGAANVEESFNLYREAEISVTCRAENWQAALGVADQELRRALAFGFRVDELKEAVADFRTDLEQSVKTASTRRSEDLANEISDDLLEKEVFTSPSDDLALLGPLLDKVTPADCDLALQNAWKAPGRSIFVSGSAKIEGDSNAVLAAAYAKSQAIALGLPPPPLASSWAYSNFGAPGKVASQKYVNDLDFTEVVFENGVRLNLKHTDFEANTIHVSARLGTGQLTEPAATEPGLSAFTSLTYTPGGLGKHSVDDLVRILAGRTVEAQFGSALDAFVIGGQTDREDLALEFQLLTASITDPGYRPEAQRDARKRIDVEYNRFEHTSRGPLALEVGRILASGDPRFGLPPKDAMMARTLNEERAWLAPTLAHGALEISVCGDFDVETAIADAAKTIGTLPGREPRPALDDLRKVSFPEHPFAKDYSVDTRIPKSLVATYWPTSDGRDIHRARRLNILADVLSDRLRVKVREQLGSTYAPTVASSAGDVFPGYGYMVAVVEVDPTKADDISKVVVGVAGDLFSKGVTPDELDRAKNPVQTAILETERTNGYWMTVLGRAQEKPEVLDWARSRETDFKSITKSEIDALARLYLSPENASRVIIHPAGPRVTTPTPKAKTPPPPPPDA
ncbi:MAG TPA: insulinase family protein [Opitutaceae bacterium]